MSLEKLDEAYKRYSSHLVSVKQRNIEDAKARILAEYRSYINKINSLFDNTIETFEKKIK